MKVRVKVAVAVDCDGDWSAFGGKGVIDTTAIDYAREGVSDLAKIYWLEAELEAPSTEIILAEVTEAFRSD